MAFWYLNIAAFIAAVGAVFHGYVGGRIYLGHINGSDLEDLTKSLSVVSWQVFTIWLAVARAYWSASRSTPVLDSWLSHHCSERIVRTAVCFPWFHGTRAATEITRCLPHGATAGLAYLGVG